jgi:transposase
MHAITIGIDLAKSIFQLHGVDRVGKVVLSRQVRRGELPKVLSKLAPALVGLEACGSAHHWAREIAKLGHEVRLMPPAYVKAYVRRQKNDRADAAAICEAVQRPSMRFVPVKSVEQQAALMVHSARDLLIRQRTQLVNAVRGHLAEMGLVAAAGREGFARLVAVASEADLPEPMCAVLTIMIEQIQTVSRQIAGLDRQLKVQHAASTASRALESIPGFGLILSTAMVATVTQPTDFRSGRELAAWIGLVPRQHSTGGKDRLGGITKQGNRSLRRLLIVGATAVIRHAEKHPERNPWLIALLARKPRRVAAVALANKMTRVAWAILVKGGTWRSPVPALAA